MKISAVTPADAGKIVEIYNHYILTTCITYEYDSVSAEEYAKRIEATVGFLPYLKAEKNGEIVGYAYAAPFHERRAFDWDCEVSVYVKQGHTGKGVGRALYSLLLSILDRQGYLNIYSLINHPNPASEALHREFGFEPTQLYTRTGYKFGRWLDMLVMTRRRSGDPAPLNSDWERILSELQSEK